MGEAKRRRLTKPSPDSDLVILSPDEASQRLAEGRTDDVYLPVVEFCECFGISRKRFLQEAKAGRLKFSGIQRGPGVWSDLAIRADVALEWLARYKDMN